LRVLKICNRYRGLSRFVCKTCGKAIPYPAVGSCDECEVGRAMVSKTGTWLDRF